MKLKKLISKSRLLVRFIQKITLRKWLLLIRRRSIDHAVVFFTKLLMRNKQVVERQEILLQNRELSLLNELRVQVRSLDAMRSMLEHFLKQAVSGLQLHSAVIQMRVMGEYLDLPCKIVECPCDRCERLQGRECYCSIVSIHYLVFPIGVQDNRIGQLAICSYLPLNQQSVNILHSLANQIAVTAENLRLWDELKQKEEVRLKLLDKVIRAQEEERKRIARELHDETSQSLTSILLGLSMLADKKTEQARSDHIRGLRSLVQETLEEVHDLAWQLRPSVLDKYGLSTALERYLEQFKTKYPIDADLCMIGLEGQRLKSEVEISVYRIVQEALTNVARYAKANNVSVIVNRMQGTLSVIVEDDGEGFDAEQVLAREPSRSNLGLRGMQERALLLNGTLTIESERGVGTTIFVHIPVLEYASAMPPELLEETPGTFAGQHRSV
ncbi:MAG: integral rane sensor signal transduction histidine kinase [Paenibacillaceae bacterium]|jgi:signal transduction histidine kinase|nr:integral rane sensor signal transduction histidine kinase [Paenibacillaceae bacterium]